MDTSIPNASASAVHPPVVPTSDGAAKASPGTDRDVAKPATSPPSTTVTLSPAAQAAQEASETPEQTAREARGNDSQAQRLVAKQAAVERMYAGEARPR